MSVNEKIRRSEVMDNFLSFFIGTLIGAFGLLLASWVMSEIDLDDHLTTNTENYEDVR